MCSFLIITARTSCKVTNLALQSSLTGIGRPAPLRLFKHSSSNKSRCYTFHPTKRQTPSTGADQGDLKKQQNGLTLTPTVFSKFFLLPPRACNKAFFFATCFGITATRRRLTVAVGFVCCFHVFPDDFEEPPAWERTTVALGSNPGFSSFCGI